MEAQGTMAEEFEQGEEEGFEPELENKGTGAFRAVMAVAAATVVGVLIGILIAPKAGAELRDDLSDWAQRGRKKSRHLASKVSRSIPTKMER